MKIKLKHEVINVVNWEAIKPNDRFIHCEILDNNTLYCIGAGETYQEAYDNARMSSYSYQEAKRLRSYDLHG